MLRRRLTAYTMMYAAGIAAGCFVFERNRVIEAAGLMLSLSAAVYLSDTGSEKDVSAARTFRIVCISLIASGFILFAYRYHIYGSFAEKCLETNAEGTAVCHRLEGRVVSASYKDSRLILTIDSGCRVQAYIRDPENNIDIASLPGSRVICTGEYKELMPADDPGCFDYRMFMRARGTAVSFRALSIDTEQNGKGPIVKARRYLYGVKEVFIGRFSEDTSGFIRGVIFGDKSEIDDEVIREFNANSTGHILAVSGLHIGFLYSLLKVLSGRRKTKSAALAIVVILLVYGEMTMWSAATVRAVIVMSISLLSVHFRRPFDLLSAVSLAAFIILTHEPYQLFDAGFRMSFIAMASMAFLTKPLSVICGKTLGAMMAVQLGLMPLLAYSFCRVNMLAVFINIPVIMLASVLVPVCMIMLISETAAGTVPALGISLAEMISSAVLTVNHSLSFDEGFSYMTAGAGAFLTAVLYIVVFTASSEWFRVSLIRKNYRELIKNAVLLLMPLLMLSACMTDTLKDDEIVFVSVGQGDCVHIRAEGRNILIDGGGRDDMDVGERILMPYLLHSGADTVDIALVTHLHMDHCKGLLELAQIYPVGALGIPSDYRDTDVRNLYEGVSVPENRDILLIKPGAEIRIAEDIYIEVLWPITESERALDASDPNEHNTVYMISYKGVRVMVTGDLLEKDELDMIDHYTREGTLGKLSCDILKVAHHGSRSSSSDAFLDAAAPDLAVIQAGAGNVYGHPHKETLGRLSERGIRVFRTDEKGAVGIDIKRNGIKAECFRNN